MSTYLSHKVRLEISSGNKLCSVVGGMTFVCGTKDYYVKILIISIYIYKTRLLTESEDMLVTRTYILYRSVRQSTIKQTQPHFPMTTTESYLNYPSR